MPMFSTFMSYIMYITLNRYTYLLIFFLVRITLRPLIFDETFSLKQKNEKSVFITYRGIVFCLQ